LIKTADCGGCHTGWYKRNPGYYGGGNGIQRLDDTTTVFSTNLTPHPTGLGGWSPALFIQVIRTGKAGSLDPVMPWVAFKNMTDEDLKAIHMALQQLPAVNHTVVNSVKATYCVVCEERHGNGEHNQLLSLKAVAVDHSQYSDFSGTYRHPKGFAFQVSVRHNKLMLTVSGDPVELVPIAKNRFQSLAFPESISFKRDASGRVKWLVSHSMDDEQEVLVRQARQTLTK
jgi:hypothetical protein